MRKLFLGLAACLLAGGTVLAQQTTPVHLSVYPPISTNGKAAAEYTNHFSFSIFSGVSRNERGLAFAGFSNSVGNNVTGLAFAGLFNTIGGDVKGLAFAGLSNRIGGNVNGMVFGGLANRIKGDFRGLAFAGLFNTLGEDLEGLAFAGLFNRIGGDVNGLVFGGLANDIKRDFRGLEFAGLSNRIRGNANGLAFAGIANLTQDYQGLQFAGITNVTADMRGIQFAGVVNTVKDLRGVQFAGVVNVARDVHGVQFGVVNIARTSDYPVGLINISAKGELSAGVSYNSAGSTVAEFRSGGRVLYGIIGIGHNHKYGNDNLVTEGGIGAHINICKVFRINNEVTSAYIGTYTHKGIFHQSYSLMPAFRIGRYLEIFAGGSLNSISADASAIISRLANRTFWNLEHCNGSGSTQFFWGYIGGLHYIF